MHTYPATVLIVTCLFVPETVGEGFLSGGGAWDDVDVARVPACALCL